MDDNCFGEIHIFVIHSFIRVVGAKVGLVVGACVSTITASWTLLLVELSVCPPTAYKRYSAAVPFRPLLNSHSPVNNCETACANWPLNTRSLVSLVSNSSVLLRRLLPPLPPSYHYTHSTHMYTCMHNKETDREREREREKKGSKKDKNTHTHNVHVLVSISNIGGIQRNGTCRLAIITQVTTMLPRAGTASQSGSAQISNVCQFISILVQATKYPDNIWIATVPARHLAFLACLRRTLVPPVVRSVIILHTLSHIHTYTHTHIQYTHTHTHNTRNTNEKSVDHSPNSTHVHRWWTHIGTQYTLNCSIVAVIISTQTVNVSLRIVGHARPSQL